MHKLPGLWTARPFGWQKVVLDFFLLLLLLRVVRRERIQVIHAHNLEGPLLAYVVRFLTGVPVVYHAHNALTDELPCYFYSGWARRLARRIGVFLDHRIARWADYSIALSDRLAAFLAVRGAGGRIVTVPPGIGHIPSNGRPATRREGGPLIMYAGNLDPYQNLGCLLEGFDRVCAAEPRARLVLVTHKAAYAQNRQRALLANRAGVVLRPVATFAAAARDLRQADVLICPRSSWSGFPIKVLNYMALGRPVVQARGSAHVIEDGVNGLLFAENDPISLAKAVLRVVRDPALAMRLGCEAKSTVRGRFAWPNLLPRVQEVYDCVVEDRERGGGPRRRIAKPMEPMMKKTPKRVGSGEPLARSLNLVGTALLIASIAGCSPSRPENIVPLPPLSVAGAPGTGTAGNLYRLQPGDVLRVKFLYHPELDVKIPVGPDGTVAIQEAGEIMAQGKTADELAGEIQKASSKNLRDPAVSVIVAEVGPRKIYVGGEVRLPGPVIYREGMTPLQAILDRGGFTEVAQSDNVLHGTIKDNNYEFTRIDLSKNIDTGAPDMTALQVNDVIYVPRNFIGDANAVVRLYVRGLLPTIPRVGVGVTP